MQVRLEKYDKNNDVYHPIGYTDFIDYSETLKMLHYMKENEIPLEINGGMIDNPGEEYYIKDISFVMPNCGSSLISYIAVYLD